MEEAALLSHLLDDDDDDEVHDQDVSNIFFKWANTGLFLFIFVLFPLQFQ